MNTEEKKNNWQTITCPFCKAEYLPGEIFYPDDLFGKVKNVLRDPTEHILFVEYEEGCEPTLTEHFECYNCGRPFVVEAQVSFKVKEEAEELDFSNQYVNLLD